MSHRPPPPRMNSRSPLLFKYILISALYALMAGIFVINIVSFSHVTPNAAATPGTYRQLGAGSASSSSSSSLKEQPHQQQQDLLEANDGTFNGAPIWLHTTTDNKPHSRSHCIGDNFQKDGGAWKFRSCHYSFLCFNTTSKDYVMFPSPEEQELVKALADMPLTKNGNPMIRSSTTLSQTVPSGRDVGTHQGGGISIESRHAQSVAIGGINFRWGRKAAKRLEWSPNIINLDNITAFSYYELPPSAVMIPFHSLSGSNPGHLIWDDFMSIFSLLEMFDLTNRELLMMRYILHDVPLWLSCDWNTKKKDCEQMIRKALPLMVGNNARYHMSTTLDFNFAPHTPGQSDLVCARSAVAGIGSLTDHGVGERGHGWELKDYEETHNHGRGAQIYAFRNFCLNNLGLTTVPLAAPSSSQSSTRPRRIVFSQSSSKLKSRSSMFEVQMDMAETIAPSASIEGYVFKDLSMKEQITIMSETSIFLSFCGGGAVVATFLPKGASVIMFYTTGARAAGASRKERGYEAFLDWDLFQSMTHVRVHWVSAEVLKEDSTGKGNDALMKLIAHEISVMDSQALDESSTY